MNTVSRRSVVGTLFSGALLSLALPRRAKAADQPHMQSALDALRTAERELHEATADKGGHRVKAERLVHDAIAEVERGIEFDRRHLNRAHRIDRIVFGSLRGPIAGPRSLRPDTEPPFMLNAPQALNSSIVA